MAKKAIELYIGVSPTQAAMLRSDGIMRVRWFGKSIPCKKSLLAACEAYQEHHNEEGAPPFASNEEGAPPFAVGVIINSPLFLGLMDDGILERRSPAGDYHLMKDFCTLEWRSHCQCLVFCVQPGLASRSSANEGALVDYAVLKLGNQWFNHAMMDAVHNLLESGRPGDDEDIVQALKALALGGRDEVLTFVRNVLHMKLTDPPGEGEWGQLFET